MRKNNWWNRIFHKKEIASNFSELAKVKSILAASDKLLYEIKNATTLEAILVWHKRAWRAGFQNENLGPDKYGMFRTNDINKMTIDEVFLGGIYGLCTFPISEWEYADEQSYAIVKSQYQNLLSSNIDAIKEKALKDLKILVAKGYETKD